MGFQKLDLDPDPGRKSSGSWYSGAEQTALAVISDLSPSTEAFFRGKKWFHILDLTETFKTTQLLEQEFYGTNIVL